jgi:uncharacterized protein YkwD
MRNNIILLVFLVISLITTTSCATSISQEDVDKLNEEISEVHSKLQGKMAETEKLAAENKLLQNQYDDVMSKYESLQEQYDSTIKNDSPKIDEELNEQLDMLEGKYNTLKADYEKLDSEYQDLRASYEAITVAVDTTYTEQDVEQQIFRLVNEERKTKGMDELEWGLYLYKRALANSKDMAAAQEIVYSSYGAYQDIFRAVGYDTAEKLSEAAMTIWKNGKQFERKFLNSVTLYGAVAVYKSGEIYYITYIADYFK